MAKQSFVTGQVLTAAQLTSLQQTAMSGGAASAKTASYTLVAADAGTAISMSSTSATTITINTGLFAAGDTIFIQNLNTGICTITAGTATVNTSASLALAQYEGGTLYFTSASAALFFKADGAAPSSGGMTLLNSGGTTLSGASVTINVTTTGYTALKIYIQNSYASVDTVAGLRINGDTASNYSQSFLRASGIVNFASQGYYRICEGMGTSSATLTNTNIEIDIFNPTFTDQMQIGHKAMNGPSGDIRFSVGKGVYDCAAAITSIGLIMVSGDFSGGTAYVYGVK